MHFLESRRQRSNCRGGPWSIKGALLNLKRWSPDLTLNEVSFSHCNFWIQIYNLPLNRRNKENLNKIGQYVGEFIQYDVEHTHQSLQMFVRIMVSVNILEALKPGCFILRESGEKLWLAFKYERISDFCYCCGKIDHSVAACHHNDRVEHGDMRGEQGLGPWMRDRYKGHTSWSAQATTKGTPEAT